ncbi:ROK family transcriptional regulator [Phytoactinopolyspora mesophila]|uniref:ROK family protein n=1 Tax=Phytoactinopolyspora mesophila TaxID=2650750 RepID=A0A7K3MBQ4_9ACTN|nr:ROK family transcriptional regulator [Phytoactinopolyspora mesophila]NDL60744.1 ROK family protein [Phytoactinopolyspora mesophila]
MPLSRGDLTRSAVLAVLGASGPLSRSQIAQLLEVSPATVTQVTKDLIARGMVAEVNQAPSRGGRPAVLLGVVGSAGRALGAKVAADHVAAVEVSLDGQVIRAWEWPFEATAADALDQLIAILRPLTEPSGDNAPLLGIGIGVPGAVDDQAVGVVDAPTLGWQHLPLGAQLQSALPVPVLVENDVNTLAVTERLYGRGREHRDFLVVTIGRGIGAGLVIDGSVYRGSTGGAGEFGHLPVNPDGPACSCGNNGCLEALIGQDALLRRAREQDLISDDANIGQLLAVASGGDPSAQLLFHEAGETLGRAVGGLVNVMDPQIVVVLGEGTRGWQHWRNGFDHQLRAHALPARRGVPVVVETWDDSSWALGAAALVLATPFDASGLTGSQGELVRARLDEALTQDSR